jgi:integrase
MASRKPAGRPSKVAGYRDLLTAELRARPASRGADLLALAKRHGYTGGPSALYASVAVIRTKLKVPPLAERQATARGQRQTELVARRMEAAARRERLDAEVRARKAERAGADELRRVARERERDDRLVRTGELVLEHFRPLAEDEQSTKLRVLARRWLDSREATHKSNDDDRSRWRTHLCPAFGDLEPGEVDQAKIRAFVEERLASGLVSTTVRNCMMLLSSLFTELVEQGLVGRNPVSSVPRPVKRLYRRAHDPKTTPYLERQEDVAHLRSVLNEPLRTMFCVGVMAGLRTGEIVALHWSDLSADMSLIHVQRRYRLGNVDTPKSGHGRVVPIPRALAAILSKWKEATGGTGPIFKGNGDAKYIAVDGGAFRAGWYAGLERAGLAPILFYRATRHTFASHWVKAGHPIERLSKILGHSSVMVTEIYAHLKPESLTVPDVFSLDLRVEDPKVTTSTADRLIAELAESRAQVSRLTDLLAQQSQALNQVLAGRRKVTFTPTAVITVPGATT